MAKFGCTSDRINGFGIPTAYDVYLDALGARFRKEAEEAARARKENIAAIPGILRGLTEAEGDIVIIKSDVRDLKAGFAEERALNIERAKVAAENFEKIRMTQILHDGKIKDLEYRVDTIESDLLNLGYKSPETLKVIDNAKKYRIEKILPKACLDYMTDSSYVRYDCHGNLKKESRVLVAGSIEAINYIIAKAKDLTKAYGKRDEKCRPLKELATENERAYTRYSSNKGPWEWQGRELKTPLRIKSLFDSFYKEEDRHIEAQNKHYVEEFTKSRPCGYFTVVSKYGNVYITFPDNCYVLDQSKIRHPGHILEIAESDPRYLCQIDDKAFKSKEMVNHIIEAVRRYCKGFANENIDSPTVEQDVQSIMENAALIIKGKQLAFQKELPPKQKGLHDAINNFEFGDIRK